jgi:hypothetical protein
LRSGGLDAVCLKYSFIEQQSGYADPFFYEVDRRAGEFETVDPAIVAFE